MAKIGITNKDIFKGDINPRRQVIKDRRVIESNNNSGGCPSCTRKKTNG